MNGKCGSAAQIAIGLDGSAMGFHNGLCQRQPQTNPLGILRKPAAIKALEDMGKIFRMDAAAIILDGDLDSGGKLFPFYPDGVPRFCMVKGIFDQIAHRFHQPSAVTGQHNGLITVKMQFLSSLLGLIGKLPFHAVHDLREILDRFFQHNASRVQFGNFQKILY